MSSKRSSILLIGLIIAGILSGDTSSAADEARIIKLRLDWRPLGTHGPIYLAAEKGWFKDAGLEVTIEQGTGSVITVQQVDAGHYDVGWASLPMMVQGRAKGMSSLVAIAGIFRKFDLALIVPKDSSIKKPADVKGKKLIFTAGSFEAPFIDAFLEKGGLTRDQVELTNLGYAARASTLVSGRADGLFGGSIGDYTTVASQTAARLLLFADVGLDVPSSGLFARQDVLKKKGDALRTFASIIAGSWAYVLNGHEKEAAQAVIRAQPQARLDPELTLKQVKLSLNFLHSANTSKRDLPIGVHSEDDWAAGIALLEKAKMIEPGSKVSEYFTNEYLDLELVKKIATKK
jgi:NitT/TauT family transport system substrate-binding protein